MQCQKRMNFLEINKLYAHPTCRRQASVLLLAALLLVLSPLRAQQAPAGELSLPWLQAHGEQVAGLQLLEQNDDGYLFDFYVGNIGFLDAEDASCLLWADGVNGYCRKAGAPKLPQHRVVLQVPQGVELCGVVLQDEECYHLSLAALGCQGTLATVPNPVVKNLENSELDMSKGVEESPLMLVEELGVMRGQRWVRVTLSPFEYDADLQRLVVHSHLRVALRYTAPKESTGQQYHNALDEVHTPQSYVVVAPTRFAATLQPLLRWKRQEGFQVVEHYTDVAQRDSIRAYLQARYDNATALEPAPLYVLLVGDVADIPPFRANHNVQGLNQHVTDLYYAEYTGDVLPDALLGRISVSDTATLRAVVEKTLAYEQYRMADKQYLNAMLLVAGKEQQHPAPLVTNGQVNYLKTLLMAHDSTLDTFCYYNPSSDSCADAIYQIMRQGVGMVDYTAHCNAYGWMHPQLTRDQVDTLPSSGRYFLSINNCCNINSITSDCMGEHLLGKADAGAVGVIGASNETLWDEDYYWNLGYRATLSDHPQPSDSLFGAMDRWVRNSLMPNAERAVTQSQIVMAGNWAVTESGSQFADFYWEIYHLLGDPSLMPYIGTPDSMSLTVAPVHRGDRWLTLQGEPYTRVAASRGDTLLGVCTLDDMGYGMLETSKALTDSVLLTATKQFRIPQQTTVTVEPFAGGRLVLEGCHLEDMAGAPLTHLSVCDSALLTLTLRNVGDSATAPMPLWLYQSDVQAAACRNAITYDAMEISALPSGDSRQLTVVVYPLRPVGEALCSLTLALGDSTDSQLLRFPVAMSQVEVTAMEVMLNGQPVERLQEGRRYELHITLKNKAQGAANEVTVSLADFAVSQYVGRMAAGEVWQGMLPFLVDSLHLAQQSLRLEVTVTDRLDTTQRSMTLPVDVVGIAEVEDERSAHLYPNPASNMLTITALQGEAATTEVTLYDYRGRAVDKLLVQNGASRQYSVAHLRCGLYHVVLRNGERQEIKKLIIIR